MENVHVLLVPFPAQAHITTFLQFAKRLVSKGLKTTLAITAFSSRSMHSDPSSSINVETFSDGYDGGGRSQAKSTEDYLESLQTVGSRTLAHLIEKVNEDGQKPPIVLVVYDSFMPWALDVSRGFGLLTAAFLSSCNVTSFLFHNVYRGLLLLPVPEPKFRLPGLSVELENWETPVFSRTTCRSFPAFSKLVLVDRFSNIDEADWVLSKSFDKLEQEVVDQMSKLWNFKTVGPQVPSMYLDKRLPHDTSYVLNLDNPDASQCMEWLASKPQSSVIYVSFGSLIQLERKEIEEIAYGLKQTDRYILWSIRDRNRSAIPQNFMDEVVAPGKGVLVNWCPQLQVLAHESVDCFVTHCGFSSVLEAICLGVPTVGVPRMPDQVICARYVEDFWGVGVRTRIDEDGIVTRDALEEGVRGVMEGGKAESVRRNLARWSRWAKEAVDEGGSSDTNINEFVEEIIRKKKR